MDAPPEAAFAGPSLSAVEIVKLHSATTLALCAALESCGMSVGARMAVNLRKQIAQNDGGAWSLITAAIADVLEAALPGSPCNDNRTAESGAAVGKCGITLASASVRSPPASGDARANPELEFETS